MSLQSEVGALSDDTLDAAYNACLATGDTGAMAAYGDEIKRRENSISGVISGLFGAVRFPLYQAHMGKNSTAGYVVLLAVGVGAYLVYKAVEGKK